MYQVLFRVKLILVKILICCLFDKVRFNSNDSDGVDDDDPILVGQ